MKPKQKSLRGCLKALLFPKRKVGALKSLLSWALGPRLLSEWQAPGHHGSAIPGDGAGGEASTLGHPAP